MRILTLNINKASSPRVDALVSFLAEESPDVAVLTEFVENGGTARLQAGLTELGLIHHSVSRVNRDPATGENLGGGRVATFSKFPFHAMPDPDFHLLTLRLERLDLVGVYFPQKKAKRPVFQKLHQHLIPALQRDALLLGDFNTGRLFEDEEEPFHKSKAFDCVDDFEGILAGRFIDSWRIRNRARKEFSWHFNAGLKRGFRIDHVLSTPNLDARIRDVRYNHASRTAPVIAGKPFTDHSALVVDLDL